MLKFNMIDVCILHDYKLIIKHCSKKKQKKNNKDGYVYQNLNKWIGSMKAKNYQTKVG